MERGIERARELPRHHIIHITFGFRTPLIVYPGDHSCRDLLRSIKTSGHSW